MCSGFSQGIFEKSEQQLNVNLMKSEDGQLET